MDITENITVEIAKKILANERRATQFLLKLNEETGVELPLRKITKGINKGVQVLNLKTVEKWAKIVATWDYEIAIRIIRNLFKTTQKYNNGLISNHTMRVYLAEWDELNLGNFAWPFSQGDFDGFVQQINAENTTAEKRDLKVKDASVKYRRVKEINTLRNDYIETLVFDKNENILPTLNHRRSVDFFINGISFDQKVAKSPTNQFKAKYGDDWKNKAIQHPEIVAEYLYKLQDEGRFGADSRLLVVYLDEDVSIERINEIVTATDLTHPIKVKFTFKHKTGGNIDYVVECFVILLHN
jgi:hypothetical protein